MITCPAAPLNLNPSPSNSIGPSVWRRNTTIANETAAAPGRPITAAKEVLLALTVVVGVITLGTGRTTVLQGIVHLAIFAAFLFLAVVP